MSAEQPIPDLSIPEENLKILRTKSLSGAVFESLEHAILNGEMEPGERINETTIAEKYGVSRGPVREACRKLEESGLADFIVNRGVFVKKLAFDDALEIYQIRAALFAFGGRILARRITNEQIAVLSGTIDEMEEATERQDPDAYYTRNLEFHSALMRFTGSQRLFRLYESMNKELHLFRRRSFSVDLNRRASYSEHRTIVEELKSGNPSRIARAMRVHSMAGINRVVRLMDLSEEQRTRLATDWDDGESDII